MHHLVPAALLAVILASAAVAHAPATVDAQPRPDAPSVRASSGTDPYLGISIDELRTRMGPPEAIAGYEYFSWFSRSKAYPPDQWEAVSGQYMARADVYYRKTANNKLTYEFLLRPDIRQSRQHPTLRITDYSITFEKPVRLRDLPSVFTELGAVAREPAIAYEGRVTMQYNRNSLVVQKETEATAAIANGFWEEEGSERGDPSANTTRYGPQYQLWFAGDVGLFAATGDSRVERVTVGVGPIGKPAKDDRNRPGEVRELPTLGAFFAR